jgi:high-affinity nickel-transport protein
VTPAQDGHLRGGFGSVRENFDINKAGFGIVGVLIAVWIIALAVWRYGHIEVNGNSRLRGDRGGGPR